MTTPLSLICLPILLISSLPLMLFAILTTTLAFSTLLFRVLLVYAELALVLLRTNFSPRSPSAFALPKSSTSQPKSPSLFSNRLSYSGQSSHMGLSSQSNQRRPRRPSSSSNNSTLKPSGSTTPLAPSTSGLAIYSSGNASRDFEGLGGWRVSGIEDDEEDVLWAGMNRRLELPTQEKGSHHRRSYTGGSAGGGVGYAGVKRSPGLVGNRGGRKSGGESPEEYSMQKGANKSTTELDTANVGRVRKANSRERGLGMSFLG